MLAKHELLKVPLIGWTWYFLEVVFCKRKWEEDKKAVTNGLNQLKDYPENMWVSQMHRSHHFSIEFRRSPVTNPLRRPVLAKKRKKRKVNQLLNQIYAVYTHTQKMKISLVEGILLFEQNITVKTVLYTCVLVCISRYCCIVKAPDSPRRSTTYLWRWPTGAAATTLLQQITTTHSASYGS